MTQADRIQSAVLICGVFAFVAGADAGVTECRPCGARAVSFGSTAVACGTCGSALSTTCSPSPGCGQWIEQEYVVHEPTWVNETRTIACTEYATEQQVRERVERVPYREARRGTRETCRTVYSRIRQTSYVSVPYQVRQRGFQLQRQLVTVPVKRSYCVVVPQTEVREEVRTDLKRVTTRRKESVSVLVKGHEVRQGTRTVCRTLREQRPVEYQIMVPFVETREGTRSVCRRVAVTEMQNVAAPSLCGDTQGPYNSYGCGQAACQHCQGVCSGCVSSGIPVVQYATEEHVEPYTYTVRGCRPETHVRMETVVRNVPIQEAFTYTVPVWNRKQRQRTVQATTYVPFRKKYRYKVTTYRKRYETRITHEPACRGSMSRLSIQ